MPFRSLLLVPLVIMALLGGAAGYLLTEQLEPRTREARVSVVMLPSTPAPTPSPTPKAAATSKVRIRTGGGTSDGNTCPAGCTCDRRPNGIVIRCTGG